MIHYTNVNTKFEILIPTHHREISNEKKERKKKVEGPYWK